MKHLVTIGSIVYRLYNWKSKVKWYYDLGKNVFFVDPQFEQEFIQKVRQGY